MINVKEKRQCSGCHTCALVCPNRCITMVRDVEGFQYPIVEESLCIECGLCEIKCPVMNPACTERKESDVTAYAAYTKDESIRMKSSSGGLFTEIAKYVLQEGGVVFGAAFDEYLNLKHISVETVFGLEKLRGSKYVQSEIGTSFQEAKHFLDAGRMVLFTGTPCQIAGLYSYLNKDYEKLLTQDIVCHGVPSPMVWEKYLQFTEKNMGKKLKNFNFRNKKSGWKTYSLQLFFYDQTQCIKSVSDDLYMQCFINNLCLRPSCYACAFKQKVRQSDITLADFWGIENVLPDMDDDLGTSLFLINSKKGRMLFTQIQAKLHWKPVNLNEAIRYNSSMIMSSTPANNRNTFMQSIESGEFEQTVRLNLKKTMIVRLKKIIKRALRLIGIKK